MIEKDLEPFTGNDPLARAGRKAEEQIAFYLRRALADEPDIHVFNNLRLAQDGDAAQMDHLILHAQGLVIIESKSVSDSVEIDAHGRWTRWWNRRPQGMASPIRQAELQADFLLRYLDRHALPLLAALSPRPVRFADRRIDVLVAISDRGRINVKKGAEMPPEICKADEVIERLGAILSRGGGLSRLLLGGAAALKPSERLTIAEFLLDHHTPVGGQARKDAKVPPPRLEPGVVAGFAEPVGRGFVSPTPSPRPAPSPPAAASAALIPGRARAASCKACGSNALSIQYGKFGYYWKCRDCGGNTKLLPQCPQCGTLGRTAKRELEFAVDCAQCGPVLFHVNEG